MTVSAYELANPARFRQAIRDEFVSSGSEAAAEEIFCRRYKKLQTTTAYIRYDVAKDVFLELFGREPEC